MSFLDTLEGFAKSCILTRPDLGESSLFPEDIWASMGEQGLLNPWALGNLPGEQNQNSGFCRDVAAHARVMTATGGCLGLTLSWIIHHLVARHLVFSSLGGISDALLKHRISTGQATICFAVSEPDAGAHPKYMKATAEKDSHGYTLNGHKAFLSNGPIAGGFLVVAITGQSKGKNEFSAFLVDRNTPGLAVGEPMDIAFFKPCPHGRIRMENCRVGHDVLVGIPGQAFDAMVLPFRTLEDAVMTGPLAGAMTFLLNSTVVQLKGLDDLGRDEIQALGSLAAQVDAAVFMSQRIAGMADRSDLPEHRILESLIMHFRQCVTLFLEQLNALHQKTGCSSGGPAKILEKDLALSAGISKKSQASKQQKMGRNLLDNFRLLT